ncbi:hypothetical protein B0O99DRAFT_746976 [Bisporella sp. PMI_857]|nr:hypothetical protein B0O99DRAFT_746976 [Bisporella sp. PMI_857]
MVSPQFELLQGEQKEVLNAGVLVTSAWALLASIYANNEEVKIRRIDSENQRRENHEQEEHLISLHRDRNIQAIYKDVEDIANETEYCKLWSLDLPLPFDTKPGISSIPTQNLTIIELAQKSTQNLEQLISGYASSGHMIVIVTASEISFKWEIHLPGSKVSATHKERLFNQFSHVVDQLKKSTAVTVVRDLDLICLNDLEHIQKWNKSLPVPVEDCIHYIIGRRAEESPNSPAVCAWDGSLTYWELSDLSNRLAKHLIESGVGPEVFVPICFEKSVWSIVSLVAILKAGGACVPLDPAHPKSRHLAILANLKPSLIVCSQSLEGLCRELEYPVVTVTPSTIQAQPLNSELSDPTQVMVQPGNAAFAVFTSGSTGQPKGIIIEHGAMCTSARDHGEVMKFGPHTRVIQFAAFTFDDSFSDVFTTLMYGGCICVPSDNDRLNNLAKCIVQMDANQACLTTTIARQLRPEDVPCLKILSVGGEALTSQLLEQWADHVYLINAYGPAEASIFCSALAGLSTTDDPNNVGTAMGCLQWITDTMDHNKLSPIGAVGELLIEGPILARCYIQNKEKTEAAFIENPSWATLENGSQISNRRFYKTGDLARYNEDGTIQILGRKDTQVKLRGQRIELGEIEHHVLREVKGCLEVGAEVIKPNNGAGAPMIAAFLRMQSDSISDANLLSVVNSSSDVLDGVEARLTQLLPPYMVPAAFVCLPRMPLMVSGKLDRKALRELGSSLSMDQLMGPGHTNAGDGAGSPQTAMEKKLQEIWSRVLNLPLNQIGINSSFLKLGGDSFTAIQVTSTCRAEDIEITVQDILKSKILSQVALKARAMASSSSPEIEEKIGTEFELNPIQRWNMHRTRNVPEAVKNHFNQTFVFRLRMHIQLSRLKWVIEQVLARHIMLRSRFKKSETSDQWSQFISKDTENYYILRGHNVPGMDSVEHIIHQTQKSFDLQKGPLFGADLINLPGGSQLLFLAIHCVAIDLVSWGIVLEDMEALLTSGVLAAPKSLPFSTWVKKQIQYSQKSITSAHALPFEVSPANFAYWGMEGRLNLLGDAIRQVISVPTSISALILGACNGPLKTEVIDLLLSAVIHSFGQSFTDRSLPTIFNYGHGRESWDPSLDISRTVGCFAIMCPISIPGGDPNNIIQVVKETKDVRRIIPKNGFDYFTSRHLTDDGAEVFGHHDQMEILFHYSDLCQKLGQEDSLFDQMPLKTFSRGDSSASMPASALFEIEVGIKQGDIQFTFSYNQFMLHQHKISNWISECGKSVETLAHCLSEMRPEFTLSDFPLLSLNYPDLDILMRQTLPKLEIDNLARIENIYPCSPMQEGILVAQKKRANLYKLEEIFRVSPRRSGTIDITRLERAWKQVVARHPVLRTMCVESFSENSGFQQVVLGAYEPRVFYVQAKDRPDALRTFKNYTPMNYSDSEPGHRFGICQLENGEVYFRLEIHHTLNDAMSDRIICKEIGLAYDGLLPNIPGPLYSEYINYIKYRPTSLTLSYWTNYLADIKPCRFPILNDGDVQSSGNINTAVIPFHRAGLMDSFCKAHGLTIGNLMTAVWGLLLQSYTGEIDVCFGYLTSSRDLPIPDVQDIVGPLINMVISRVSLPDSESLMNVIRKAQDDYINASPYQVCSLAEVYHALDLGGNKRNSIEIEEIEVYDPTDLELMLKVAYSSTSFKAAITYNTASISDKHASKIADTFNTILTSVLELPEQNVADVERLGIENTTQLLAWNKDLPDPVEKCVHDAVHEQALLYPNLPAVSSWDGELTYAELDDMSSRFSYYLSKAGVELEMVVPIASEKSRLVIVSQLGVLKAGGACLTMDMSNPIDRLKGMCKQVNAKLLIAARNHKDTFQDTGINTIIIDEAFIRSLPSQNEAACTTVKPNNMGFIVFTSGSTGNPKGIMLEHRTVFTASRGQQALFDIGPGSRCLQFSSYAFDVHISDIFVPLMYGGCCCIPSETQRTGDLAGAIRDAKATSTHITPTVSKQFQPEDVPLLKKVAFCGEAFTHESAKTRGGSLYAINIFGPAETSNWVSYRHVLPDTTQPSNIGSGVGVNIWLVDHQTNTHLVPVGCAGEMFIEGSILARGYLNDPAKTEAAFIKDPVFLRKYGGDAETRVYKTGDLARANTDGTFLYIGRVDSQVKIYGQRLELGEVEYAISEFPEVKHVAVVLPKSGLYGGRLVAVIVLHGITEDHGGKTLRIISAARKTEIQSKVSSLIDQISIRLAAWMVPHFWAIVNDIPSGATNKLDRGRVKQFITDINQETVEQISALTVEDQLEMPRTNIEKQLRDAWSKILGVPHDRIGTNSSFLRLGGDSLSIMRLVTEARSHGIFLSTVSVFRHPKLKDMALEAAGGESEVVSEIAPFSLLGEASMVESIREEAARECSVNAELIEDIYPCTPLQEGLMVLSITQPGTYMAQYVYKLPLGLDLIVFRQAWQLVYRTNEILRTRIINTEALGTVQVVVSDEISWSIGDKLEMYIKRDRETRMLPGLPLSRFAIVESHFIITAHHAIYDAWSLNWLLEDVVAAYQQQSLETHVPYKHFIKHVQELDQKASESFWTSELSNENTKIFPSIPYPEYQPKADTFLVQDIQFSRKPESEITTPTILEAAWALRIRRLNTATEAAYDFQTQLVIQASGTTRTGLQPLGINRTNDDSDDVLTYALTFECVLTSTGLTLNTLFDSDIIPSSQMKRIIQQFANLVQVLSEESFSTTVNDILIINAQDEKEILTWNSTLPEFVEKIVHEEIQQQALTHPDAPAICAWDGDLTYKELDILSSQLGYFLRSMV